DRPKRLGSTEAFCQRVCMSAQRPLTTQGTGAHPRRRRSNRMLTAAKFEKTVVRVGGAFDALAAARLQIEIALCRAKDISVDLGDATGFSDTWRQGRKQRLWLSLRGAGPFVGIIDP